MELPHTFDDCGGQNKNKMVIRWLVFLTQLRMAKTQHGIFLIKGHTKNDCDRMFNPLKCDCRKTNVCAPQDLVQCMNAHEQVFALQMNPQDFMDWDTFEDRYMVKKVRDVKKWHVFTITLDNPHQLQCQEAWNEPVTTLNIVKKEFRGNSRGWWLQQLQDHMGVCKEPGMPDIKWVELYSKWSKYVSIEARREFKYYCESPPDDVWDRVKANTKASKKTRKDRGRTTLTDPGVAQKQLFNNEFFSVKKLIAER